LSGLEDCRGRRALDLSPAEAAVESTGTKLGERALKDPGDPRHQQAVRIRPLMSIISGTYAVVSPSKSSSIPPAPVRPPRSLVRPSHVLKFGSAFNLVRVQAGVDLVR